MAGRFTVRAFGDVRARSVLRCTEGYTAGLPGLRRALLPMNSHMIVTGDPSQVDLPAGQTSGLAQAVRLLGDVEGIGHAVFTREDVIRHELVARIVEAYENAAARRPGEEAP